jgi:hypothetical protein
MRPFHPIHLPRFWLKRIYRVGEKGKSFGEKFIRVPGMDQKGWEGGGVSVRAEGF